MALQLTYYQLHHKVCQAYESASTRLFHHGRTEVIRGCSSKTKTFIESVSNPNLSNKEKRELLAKAVRSHNKRTRAAVQGKGIDRHLFGLRLLAKQNYGQDPNPSSHPSLALFEDVGFARSSTFVLSTSQLPINRLVFSGFAPSIPSGYGVAYNLQEEVIMFSVSCWKNKRNPDNETNLFLFARALFTTLEDMRSLFSPSQNVRVQQQQPQESNRSNHSSKL